ARLDGEADVLQDGQLLAAPKTAWIFLADIFDANHGRVGHEGGPHCRLRLGGRGVFSTAWPRAAGRRKDCREAGTGWARARSLDQRNLHAVLHDGLEGGANAVDAFAAGAINELPVAQGRAAAVGLNILQEGLGKVLIAARVARLEQGAVPDGVDLHWLARGGKAALALAFADLLD